MLRRCVCSIRRARRGIAHLDDVGLLASRGLLLGLAQLLDQRLALELQAAVEATAVAGVHKLDEPATSAPSAKRRTHCSLLRSSRASRSTPRYEKRLKVCAMSRVGLNDKTHSARGGRVLGRPDVVLALCPILAVRGRIGRQRAIEIDSDEASERQQGPARPISDCERSVRIRRSGSASLQHRRRRATARAAHSSQLAVASSALRQARSVPSGRRSPPDEPRTASRVRSAVQPSLQRSSTTKHGLASQRKTPRKVDEAPKRRAVSDGDSHDGETSSERRERSEVVALLGTRDLSLTGRVEERASLAHPREYSAQAL